MRLVGMVCLVMACSTAAGNEPKRLDALYELRQTTPEQRARIQTEFTKKQLDLTAPQLEKVTALDLEFARKADPILKGSSGLLKKHHELGALNAEKRQRLKEILSPEQFARYVKLEPELEQALYDGLKAEKTAGGG
jgi:hypothetical protein